MCVRASVYARVCVRTCVRAFVHVCVRGCICACVCDVFAIYDINILPGLIMIIIKIICIKIAHTDDFPSTGTRLVQIYSRVYDAYSP